MTLTKRIIPCLDVDHGIVVKGIHFVDLRKAGDPVELGKRYSREGADELVFLDITASPEDRGIFEGVVRAVASELDIPFTVGGGIKSVEDARLVLGNGADKVSINTAALENPVLIKELSETFGCQSVVVAIDAKRNYQNESGIRVFNGDVGSYWFETYTYGGRKATGIDAIQWSERVAQLGAGEILLTSMDRDGTQDGYDLELTGEIVGCVNVPVIASGGAGELEHFLDVFKKADADAALAASVFHYDSHPISTVKHFLVENGIPIRQ